jgi:hypothetical protein
LLARARAQNQVVLLEGALPEVGLREVVAARAQLDLLQTALVIEARWQWASWAEIGALLGMTPQGAWKRYRAVDPIPPRRTNQS